MWNALATSTYPGTIVVIIGTLMAFPLVDSILSHAYPSFAAVLQPVVLIVMGSLWARCARQFRSALRNAGINQDWKNKEPRDPPGYGFEPNQRLLNDFTAYDYLGSDLMGGESHVQCNVCRKWSIFPLLTLDKRYWDKELGIHRAICHPFLEKEE